MKKLLLVLLVLFSVFSYSQQYMLPTKLVDQYLVSGEKKDIIIETAIDKDNFYEIKLRYNDKSSTFKLKPLTFPNFKSKFKNAIVEVIKLNNPSSLKTSLPSDEDVQNEIAYVFTQFVTYYNTQEEQPEVASIFLKEDIPIYYEKKKNKVEKLEIFLEDVIVELSFFGGFIEKIQVNGKVNGIPMSFNNKFSIGISSTKNITELSDYIIYSNEKIDSTNMEELKKILTKNEFEKLEHTNASFTKYSSEMG